MTAQRVERAQPAAVDPCLGKVLGDRYRLVSRIGEGGMGTVYRAEHVVLHKRMAVKVLRPELSLDEGVARRFHQEAVVASQIGQENVVDVTDFGRTPEGSLYLVMEELDGVSLAALVRGCQTLPVDRALGILAQVCRALAAAHGRGVVHRDLKPDNVVVVRREDGSDLVKLVDFGISQSGPGPQEAPGARARTVVGTPEYMAPEQVTAAAVDHRADVYAFGVLAYELLTGTLPFQCESPLATMLEQQTREPEPPCLRRPGLPADLEALILKALSKAPEARQQSMAELAAELTRVLAGLGLPPVYERPPAEGRPPGFTNRSTATPWPRGGARGPTVTLEVPAGGARASPRCGPAAPILATILGPAPSSRAPRQAPLAALAFLLGAGAVALSFRVWPEAPVATALATLAATAAPAALPEPLAPLARPAPPPTPGAPSTISSGAPRCSAPGAPPAARAPHSPRRAGRSR